MRVYVSPFPDVDAGKVQVSADGGTAPRWNARGGELFFLSAAGDMMVARVRAAPTFVISEVVRLFSASGFASDGTSAIYDVSPDGQRFLMLDIGTQADASRGRLVIVRNFAAELTGRVPR
jgi:hypothetical protein